MANRYNVCITWVPAHRDIPGNCRVDGLAKKGMTIELSDEFFALGILLGTCRLIIDNVIVDFVGGQLRIRSERRQKSIKGWIKGAWRSSNFNKAGSALLSGHCILGTHARRIRLGYVYSSNDFCRNHGDEEQDDTFLYLLCTCPTLAWRRKRHLGAYYMEDPNELSCTDIDNHFIGSSKWFLK